jgi:hypothetical protein
MPVTFWRDQVSDWRGMKEIIFSRHDARTPVQQRVFWRAMRLFKSHSMHGIIEKLSGDTLSRENRFALPDKLSETCFLIISRM